MKVSRTVPGRRPGAVENLAPYPRWYDKQYLAPFHFQCVWKNVGRDPCFRKKIIPHWATKNYSALPFITDYWSFMKPSKSLLMQLLTWLVFMTFSKVNYAPSLSAAGCDAQFPVESLRNGVRSITQTGTAYQQFHLRGADHEHGERKPTEGGLGIRRSLPRVLCRQMCV